MTSQPKKVTIDLNFNNFLSKEIKNLINNTIKDSLSEIIPCDFITPEIFIYGGMQSPDCMLYKLLNGFFTTIHIDNLSKTIYSKIEENISIQPVGSQKNIEYSSGLKSLFKKANELRIFFNDKFITSDYILLSLLHEESNLPEYKFLRTLFNDEMFTYAVAKEKFTQLHEIINNIAPIAELIQPNKTIETKSDMSKLIEDNKKFIQENKLIKYIPSTSYCSDLNVLSKKNAIDDVFGRDSEFNKIAKIFNRKKCNNVVLVGNHGVGKTAIVEGLAKQIANGVAPISLKNCRILKLKINEITAGTQLRGMFEERIVTLIKELNNIQNAVLFIDDIQNYFNDNQRKDFDFIGLLTPLFVDSKVKIIITTTYDGYHSIFEKNSEISGKFQKIDVEPPTEMECVNILMNIKKYYESYHNVKYSNDTITTCVKLAKRYITTKSLPMSAIDILDEAGAIKKNQNLEPKTIVTKRKKIIQLQSKKDELIKLDKIDDAKKIDDNINQLKLAIANITDTLKFDEKITVDDIYQAVSEYTNIPIQKINTSEKKSLMEIDSILKKYVIGQNEAIDKITKAIKRSKMGLYPSNRPIFSCMEIGGTGVGKTYLAKKLAEEIFGDEKYLVRFDMSEYSDKTSINKLIGASAGYIGYENGGLLTQAIKNKKHAVLLLDEIEKANEDVFNLFLQILDEGFLTDNVGQKVDFKNVILIMTSNIGVKKAMNEKSIGFLNNDTLNKKDIIEKELKNKFQPEFLNRIDEIVYFNDLSDDNLRDIIKLELSNLNNKLKNINPDFSLDYDINALDFILNQCKLNKENGARPIRRIIQNDVENKIADLLIENEFKSHVFNLFVDKQALKIL